MSSMELSIHDLEAGCLVLYKQLVDEGVAPLYVPRTVSSGI